VDKVRLGIVGLGGRGYSFARMAVGNPRTSLIAIADPNTERARRVQANLGIPLQIHTNLENLLEKSDVDALIIATPDYQHKEQALLAFAAGKHLLLEKPIATTVADGLAILAAARQHDRVLYMGFNLRHHVVVREMHRLVQEERVVGTPFYLTSVEYYNGGRSYMARWNRLKKFSGGLFVHKGTHDFDVVNWVNQPAKPRWVAASAAVNALNLEHLPFDLKPGEKVGPYCQACACAYKCPDKAWPSLYGEKDGKQALFDEETARVDSYHKDLCIFASDKDTHDNAMAIVEFDNGSRAFHSEVFVTARDNRQYVVIGDRGHLEADLHEHTITLYPRWTQNRVVYQVRSAAGGHGGSDPNLVDAFLRSILLGERPLAGAVDGVWSLAVGCAAEIAREQGRIVHLAELMDVNSELLRA